MHLHKNTVTDKEVSREKGRFKEQIKKSEHIFIHERSKKHTERTQQAKIINLKPPGSASRSVSVETPVDATAVSVMIK